MLTYTHGDINRLPLYLSRHRYHLRALSANQRFEQSLGFTGQHLGRADHDGLYPLQDQEE